MALSAAVQVRLPERTEKRLDTVAKRSGLAKADLIRRAVDDFLDQVDRTGTITIAVTPGPSDKGKCSSASSKFPPHVDRPLQLHDKTASGNDESV